MRERRFILALVTVLAMWKADAGGTLAVGSPTVEDNRVILPIILSGDVGNGVAAMDFRLRYDPETLRPLAVDAGVAATQAGKQVMANAPRPGEYNVVMMGMNQSACTGGEVATVVMEMLAADAPQDWQLGIANLTMASADGAVIASEALPFQAPDSPEDDPEPDDEAAPDDASDGEATTAEEASDDTDDTSEREAERPIAASEPFAVADRSDDTERPAKKIAAPGNFGRQEGIISGDDSVRQAAESADRARQAIVTPTSYDQEETAAGKTRLQQAERPAERGGWTAEGNVENQGSVGTLASNMTVEHGMVARGEIKADAIDAGTSGVSPEGPWNRLGLLTLIVGFGLALLAVVKRFA